MGDFRHRVGKSPRWRTAAGRTSEERHILRLVRGVSFGVLVAVVGTEYHVFRVAFSLVATLAIGPNAALLCSVWCHPPSTLSTTSHQGERPAGASSASHHGEHSDVSSAGHHGETSAATDVIRGDDTRPSCAGLGVAQFLREDVRRGASALDTQAVQVLCKQFAPSRTNALPGREPWRAWLFETPPLLTVLRI